MLNILVSDHLGVTTGGHGYIFTSTNYVNASTRAVDLLDDFSFIECDIFVEISNQFFRLLLNLDNDVSLDLGGELGVLNDLLDQVLGAAVHLLEGLLGFARVLRLLLDDLLDLGDSLVFLLALNFLHL